MKIKPHSLVSVLVLIVGARAFAQPTLGVTLVGKQAVLFWTASATNYVLQGTTNIASTNWVWAKDAVPATYGSQTAVTVTNTARARFFRLIQIPTTTLDGMVLIPAG